MKKLKEGRFLQKATYTVVRELTIGRAGLRRSKGIAAQGPTRVKLYLLPQGIDNRVPGLDAITQDPQIA